VTTAIPLAGLAARLGPDDLRALAAQGFVSADRRANGKTTFKLRWRRGGRQQVRYLGSDPAAAAVVREFVARLQAPGRAERRALALLAEAARRLRAAKKLLAPRAAAAGRPLHGYTPRRRRPAAAATAPPTDPDSLTGGRPP
jgi:hypothetical protein